MSGLKEELPLPPDSPAYASTSGYTPAALRPPKNDHSAVPVHSTTPIISPPPSPGAGQSAPVFSDKYGGYGNQGYEAASGEGDDLLGAGAGASVVGEREFKGKKVASPVDTLLKLLAAMFAVLFLIVVLARMSFLPQHHAATVARYMPQSVSSFMQVIEGPSSPHPILPLLTTAREKWGKKLASQSTTFDRATRTYKSRYGLAPPVGFDKWFAFATQGRNHSLVDEYDQLMQDLAPFRALSPQELRRRTAELAQVPGISIVSIRSGQAQVHSKSGKWLPAQAFQEMIASFVHDLPDMDIAINEKPEGRVLPRQQRRVYMSDYGLEGEELVANSSDPMLKPSLKGFAPEWKRDGNVWEAYRRSCPTDSAARRLVESVRSAETHNSLVVQGRTSNKADAPTTRRIQSQSVLPVTREMTFSHDLDADFNVCDYPSLHTLHSAFYSDQRNIEYLYPVFSPSKPTGYADILIPSHHYWSPTSEFTYELEFRRGRSKIATDMDWELKKDSAYWRGKVTRGADTPPGHGSSFQKQRLVKMANQEATSANRVLVAFDSKTAALSALSVPLGIANKVSTDIAMACDPQLGECSYLRSLGYRVEPPAPMSDAWKHKVVLDIDEIGFSPRFPALMESKSAVVKASIQREFWRGWAQPWKHFIPLSSSYSELYNLVSFFEGYPASLVGARGNRTSPLKPTVLTRPSPVPELPLNADGTPFDTDKALKDIADAGTQWRQQHLRKEDMEVYVYRLMVEYARIVTGEEAVEETP
ncbi:hypothetical protein JCM10449v2_004361 [Rhodotorula kratochvilovae]